MSHFLIAILFSSGIFAQKSITHYDMKNISNELLRSSYDIIAEIKSSFESDFFFEPQINLEEWMIDLNIFAGKTEEKSIIECEESIEFYEPQLEIENWMMDSDWNYINEDYFIEDILKLEEWMCCPRNWFI